MLKMVKLADGRQMVWDMEKGILIPIADEMAVTTVQTHQVAAAAAVATPTPAPAPAASTPAPVAPVAPASTWSVKELERGGRAQIVRTYAVGGKTHNAIALLVRPQTSASPAVIQITPYQSGDVKNSAGVVVAHAGQRKGTSYMDADTAEKLAHDLLAAVAKLRQLDGSTQSAATQSAPTSSAAEELSRCPRSPKCSKPAGHRGFCDSRRAQ